MNTHASARICKSVRGRAAIAAALSLLLPFAFSSGCGKKEEGAQSSPSSALARILAGLRFGLLIAFAIGLCSSASGAVIAYEGFDYAHGTSIVGQSGGSGWGGAWNDGSGTPAPSEPGALSSIVSGSLTYIDTIGNALVVSGNKLLNSGTNRADQVNATSQPARPLPVPIFTNGATTWISFLGQRIGPPPHDRGAILMLFNTNLWSGSVGSQVSFGEHSGLPSAGESNDVWGIAPLGEAERRRTSSTHFSNLSLVVVRIDHRDDGANAPGSEPDAGDTDDLYFWINPILGIEPTTDSATLHISSADTSGPNGLGFDFAFNQAVLFAGDSRSIGGALQPPAEWCVDEIRVGTTYADVTPHVPALQDLADGLLAHWPMEVVEGNKTPDAVNRFDMDLVNLSAADLVPGKVGMCFSFNIDQQTKIPGGRLIVTPNSGHGIPYEEPELVIKTIRDVVNRARSFSERN